MLTSIAKHYKDPTFPFVTPKLDFLVMNWGLVASLSFLSFSVLILIACSLYRRYAYICKVQELEKLEKKNQILQQFFEKLEKEDQILHQFFKEKGEIKWSDMDKSQLVELIEGLEKAIEVVEKIG